MKRLIVFGVPVVILLALVFWRISSEKAATREAASQQSSRKGAAAAVDLATAGPATIQITLDAVGTVQSPYKVDLAPKVAGRIDYLEVREGDPVRKGQVLVRINPSDLEGAIVQQEAAVSEARARLAQAQITKNSNDVSIEGDIRQQQANLATAQAEYKQAKQDYAAQVQTANSSVVDATAKVKSAESDIRNSQAKVESAKADAANAKLKYERLARLLKSGFVAAQLVDDANAAYQVADKNVDVAQAQLEASQSARDSAKAQLDSANQQLSIAKRKAQVDVETAAAKLSQAQAAYDVARANRSGSAAYQQNLAALNAGVRSAEAQLAQAQSKRADTVLTSSIDGTVTARNADPGSVGTVGDPILTVQFLQWLFVNASLPIENANLVKPGQPLSLTFDAFPKRVWHGTIAKVNPAADPQSRQFTFLVRLENPGGELRPGMYAKVLVPADRIEAQVAVPKDAVDTTGSQPKVRVVDEKGIVTSRTVTLGESDDKMIQILTGLEAGDKVVALSYTPLKDGQKVRLPGQGQRGQGK